MLALADSTGPDQGKYRPLHEKTPLVSITTRSYLRKADGIFTPDFPIPYQGIRRAASKKYDGASAEDSAEDPLTFGSF